MPQKSPTVSSYTFRFIQSYKYLIQIVLGFWLDGSYPKVHNVYTGAAGSKIRALSKNTLFCALIGQWKLFVHMVRRCSYMNEEIQDEELIDLIHHLTPAPHVPLTSVP